MSAPTIEVTWPIGGRLTTRGMLVFVDGKEVAELPQGHTMRLEVSLGRHMLKVTNKLFTVEEEFIAEPDKTLRYETGMRGAGCFVPLMLLGTPALTVYLERKS